MNISIIKVLLYIIIAIADADKYQTHFCFIKIGNEYNLTKNLYWENEDLYKYLLSKNIFAIIKLKKIYDIHRDYKPIIYDKTINNFDYTFYKTTYDDLSKFNNNELLDHFIGFGQYEGRRFNEICETILPQHYREKLEAIGMLYFFDIPDNFDIYYYRRNYDDVKHLTNTEILFHYINYGFLEGRNYNKSENQNIYLNNFYLNILKKMNYIQDEIIEVINNNIFNIYSYILLNKKINNFSYLSAIKYYIDNI